MHPELALWATSCSGTSHSKKNYQTLETYGDTILKLAATFYSYKHFEDDKRAQENEMTGLK
jgi:dsRNA-specific ribonuclease